MPARVPCHRGNRPVQPGEHGRSRSRRLGPGQRPDCRRGHVGQEHGRRGARERDANGVGTRRGSEFERRITAGGERRVASLEDDNEGRLIGRHQIGLYRNPQVRPVVSPVRQLEHFHHVVDRSRGVLLAGEHSRIGGDLCRLHRRAH